MSITNDEKHDLYSILKTKLKIALQQEFYLEAMMLEYAIIEDRLTSVLRQAGIPTINKKGRDKGIQEKLDDIKKALEKHQFPIYRRITHEQITAIIEWKNIRNTQVHERCDHIYNSDEVQQCALCGEQLVKQATNFARNVKRATTKAASIE